MNLTFLTETHPPKGWLNSTKPNQTKSQALESLNRKIPVSCLKQQSGLFRIFKGRDNAGVSCVSARLMSKGTDQLCPRLSFQGCSYNKQPIRQRQCLIWSRCVFTIK